jgi:ABC-type nitrate/sulfonate/bicarbonate transport system substrate-binding protein
MDFNLQSFIISVVIVGVTLVIGIYITSEIGAQMDTNSAAANAASDVVDALATGTSWISILVVVGFATIILTMLTSGLGSAAETAGTPYY